MPPCTSFEERLEVPADQSRASTSPTERPRVTASSAEPTPTIPPPTTRMSSSWSRIAAIAAARCSGPSPWAPVGVVGWERVVGAGIVVIDAVPFPAGAYSPGLRPRSGFSGRGAAAVGRDDHVDPLELLEVGVARRRHRAAQRPGEVDDAV